MRRLIALIFVLALVAIACTNSSESEDKTVTLEEGLYTATLQVKNTWVWQNVTWEEGRRFIIPLSIVDSSEEIVSANISLLADKARFEITFRDSTLYTTDNEGAVNPNFHQSYHTLFPLTDGQREQILALNAGDIITVKYNKVVPDSSLNSITTEPVISVANYKIGNKAYVELDEALSWRGKHSRVNKEITFP